MRSKHLTDRVREIGLFSPKKRRLQVDLTAAIQYFQETYRKDGEGCFVRECSDRMRANGFKLRGSRFEQDIRKFFTMRMMKH